MTSEFDVQMVHDCFGRRVRITPERRQHILEHPEMKSLQHQIDHVLLEPQRVRRSKTAADILLFYQYLPETILGGKWMCVVVKYLESDAFVVTAYLTDKLKIGEDLWQKN